MAIFIMLLCARVNAQLSSHHFFIRENKGLAEKLVLEILQSAELVRQKISDQLKRPLQSRTEIILCLDAQAFEMQTSQSAERILASAKPQQNVIYINLALLGKYPRHQFLQTLTHEYAHIYLGKMCPMSLPRWLDEGIAMHLAGDWQFNDAFSLALARILGNYIPLANIENSFPIEPRAMHLAYLQSYSLVDYILKERYAGSPLSTLIDDLTDPKNGAERISTFWNPFLRDGLESSWRTATKYSVHNWLLVLSSSSLFGLAMTLLFIFAYIRKRQRYRPKLEQWEREEHFFSHNKDKYSGR